MARRVVGGIETQLYPPRPMVGECIFVGLRKVEVVVVVVVVVCEFGESKSRMSDLKKCRLGNISNKGKLLVRECCWMRILYKRPEDSMDYIQDPVFQNGPQFSDGCGHVQARLQGTSGAESHPKSFGVRTVPRVAKSGPASKIALSVRPAKSRVDPPEVKYPVGASETVRNE
jgi:hypothetical protein